MVGREVGRSLPGQAPATDVIELQLLLPSHQFAALEAAAVRSELTVAALLRRVIGDALRASDGGEQRGG
jgi:hypothetical protein